MSNQDQWPSLDYRVIGWCEPVDRATQIWAWILSQLLPPGCMILDQVQSPSGPPFPPLYNGVSICWNAKSLGFEKTFIIIMQFPAPVLCCLVVISLYLPDPIHTWPFPFPHRLLPHPHSSRVGKAHSPSGYSGSGALSLCSHTTFIAFSTHQNSLDS